jgi:hypothetical protein
MHTSYKKKSLSMFFEFARGKAREEKVFGDEQINIPCCRSRAAG